MKIDSIKDSRIIYARQLATSKGRLEQHALLLEGQEQILWGLQAKMPIELVFVHNKIQNTQFLESLDIAHIPYFFVTEGILKKITDTNYLVSFVGVAKNPQIKIKKKEEFALVLDGLVDHGNIGTVARSAFAFGIKNLISTSDSSDFFYKKIIDASRGKIFQTRIRKFSSVHQTINYLKNNNYQIVAMSPHAKQIQSLIKLENKPVALILGNEAEGCSQSFIDQADLVIQIPMSSQIESLNVAVAAGISMYELKIKLVIAMLIQKIYKNIGRQLGVTVELIQQAFSVELHKVTELSAMQVILLMILKCDQFMSIDQVVKDVGEHKEGLQNFLKPLLLEGFIAQVKQKEGKGIVLTERGTELLAKLWPIVEKTEEKILENFSDLEKAQLLEYISRIQDNCHKIISSK